MGGLFLVNKEDSAIIEWGNRVEPLMGGGIEEKEQQAKYYLHRQSLFAVRILRQAQDERGI